MLDQEVTKEIWWAGRRGPVEIFVKGALGSEGGDEVSEGTGANLRKSTEQYHEELLTFSGGISHGM